MGWGLQDILLQGVFVPAILTAIGAAYLYYRTRSAPNRPVMVLLLLLAAAGGVSGLARVQGSASGWPTLDGLLLLMVPPFLLFSSVHLLERRFLANPLRKAAVLAPAPLLALLLAPTAWSPENPAHLIVTGAYTAYGVLFLLQCHLKKVALGRAALPCLVAFLLYFAFGPLYSFARPALPLAPYGFAGAAGLFIHTVLTNRPLLAKPVFEIEISGEPIERRDGVFLLPPGRTGMETFRRVLSGGAAGLVLSRVHPVEAKRRLGIENTPVIHLTRSAMEPGLDPANLNIIFSTIIEFASSRKGTVIYLHSFDYLVTSNDLWEALELLDNLKRNCAEYGMMVLVDPTLLHEDECEEVLSVGAERL